MILFHDVVQILRPVDPDPAVRASPPKGRIHPRQACGVRPALVDGAGPRQPVRGDRFRQKAQRCRFIAMFRQHEIKGLSVPINGAIKIAPIPAHLHIGLVQAPGWCCSSLAPLRHSGQRRGVFHDPAVQRRMVDADATLSQNLFGVTIGHGVPDVEEDCMQDHIPRELRAFERNHRLNLIDKMANSIHHLLESCDRT